MGDNASTLPFRRTVLEAVDPPPAPPSASSSAYTTPLTLLSWNVLADGLAQSGRWAHCPPDDLEWAARQPGLLAEVDAAGADIVCLQEANHWESWWAGALADRGYEAAFWVKPGSPAARAGAPPDGCAVAWKRDRFTVVSVDGRPFDARCVAGRGGGSVPVRSAPTPADPAATDEEANGGTGRAGPPIVTSSGEALPAPTPPRGVQGALIVTLTDALSGRTLVVGCTHLKAKAGEEEDVVRGRQAAEAAARVLRAAAAAGPDPAVVLAGDFNAGPGSAAVRAPLACGLTSVWEASPWPWTTFKFRSSGVGGGAGAGGGGTGDGVGCDPPVAATPAAAPGELKVSRALVDHVFYRGAALRARWPALPEPARGLPVGGAGGYPSDHAAVCVRLGV